MTMTMTTKPALNLEERIALLEKRIAYLEDQNERSIEPTTITADTFLAVDQNIKALDQRIMTALVGELKLWAYLREACKLSPMLRRAWKTYTELHRADQRERVNREDVVTHGDRIVREQP
jgi:hypothetical protein